MVLVTSAATCHNQTPATTIYKVEGGIINSVDTGMYVWKDYVTSHTNVTQAQIDSVHKAYDVYYTAQGVAKAALEEYMITSNTNSQDIVTANRAVTDAEVSLLSLLNQYMMKH